LHGLAPDDRGQLFGAAQPSDPAETTEGLRLSGMRHAWTTIAAHPWAGVGVSRGTDHFIAPPPVPNLWLEIGVDAGVPALIAFTFAVVYTLRRFRTFVPANRDVAVVLLLWLVVAWQFVQTFPRLDVWMALFAALAWSRSHAPEAKPATARRNERTGGLRGYLPLETATTV
jgi:hypothetical protein